MYSCGSNPVGGALVGVMLPLGWPGRLKESSFQNVGIFCGWSGGRFESFGSSCWFLLGVLGSNVGFLPGVGVIRT